jgi:hypothetical protein
MISHADVEKLLGICAPGPTVLSLHLRVPLDPDGCGACPPRLVT